MALVKQFFAISLLISTLEGAFVKQKTNLLPLGTNTLDDTRLLSRDSRSTDEGNLSDEEKRIIVDEHNAYRRREGASNMEYMVWNTELARMATDYVKECNWRHSSQQRRGYNITYAMVGENLQYTTGGRNVSTALAQWYREKSNYNYTAPYCTPGTRCGHYTQIVWARSKEIGCGITVCANFSINGAIEHNYRFFGCNYGPRGNYLNVRPYRKGPACSACRSGRPWCNSGLCYHECLATDPSCQTTTSRRTLPVTPSPSSPVIMTSPQTPNCSAWACKNGGTSRIKDDLCVCNCLDDYRGDNCQFSKKEDQVGTVFNFLGDISLWRVAWPELRDLMADSTNEYCREYPDQCCGKGAITRSGSFLSSSRLQPGSGYPHEENLGKPGFVVMILGHHDPNNSFCQYDGDKPQTDDYISVETLYNGIMFRKERMTALLTTCCNITMVKSSTGPLPVSNNPTNLKAWQKALIGVFSAGAILIAVILLLLFLRRHKPSFAPKILTVGYKANAVEKNIDMKVPRPAPAMKYNDVKRSP